MADSSFEFHYDSSTSNRRRRRRRGRPRHTTPVSSHYASRSFTPFSSAYMSDNSTTTTPGRRFRNPTPAGPFASDNDTSWQGELSWQFEPSAGWRDSRNLGSVLSPWPAAASSPSVSETSRVFRRSANDYYLSRTSTGAFRSYTNPHYEYSGYPGRIELQSFVNGRDQNERSSNFRSNHLSCEHGKKSPGFLKMGVNNKEVSKGYSSVGPLAHKDEMSTVDYDMPEDDEEGRDISLSSSTIGYDHHGQGHGLVHTNDAYADNHAWPSTISRYSGGDIDQGSDDDEEDDEDEDDEGPGRKSIGLYSLFRYSTKFDMVLIFLGCLGALINGGSLPWYSYFFGVFVNNIAVESSDDKEGLMKDVQRVCLDFHFLLSEI